MFNNTIVDKTTRKYISLNVIVRSGHILFITSDIFLQSRANCINPLVPRVQKIKIRNFTLNRLLVVEFVKKAVYLGAHYSERQGLMG